MLKPNADAIYLAMADKKMSVNALADKSGVSSQTIYRVKKGYLVRPEYIGKIAEALGVKAADIVMKEEVSK